MVFEAPQSKTCEVCGTKAPEDLISTLSETVGHDQNARVSVGGDPTMPDRNLTTLSVLYCVGKRECLEGAKQLLVDKIEEAGYSAS